MEDFGIQFLSSLSPKVSRNKKTKSKGPRVLSLKKHFRRSISYDECEITAPNSSLSIIEITSSDSECSKKIKSTPKIVIEESNKNTPSSKSLTHVSDNEEIIQPSPNRREINFECLSTARKKTLKKLQAREMTRTKLSEIMNWVEDVDKWKGNGLEKEEIVTYESIGRSLLSYDEFENKTKMKENQLLHSTVILNDKECNFTNQEVDGKSIIENDYSQQTSFEKLGDCNKSCEDLLDNLYGDSWRLKKEEVLTKSERKPRRKKVTEMKNSPKSERKPKTFETDETPHFDNKKLNSNNLLRILQTRRFKNAIDSPYILKLNGLCDGNYDENDSADCDEDKKEIEASETKSMSSSSKPIQSFGLEYSQKCNDDEDNSMNSDKENVLHEEIQPLEYRIRKKWIDESNLKLKDNINHENKIKSSIQKIRKNIKTTMINEETKKSEIPDKTSNVVTDTKYNSCTTKSEENCLDVDKVKIEKKKLTECSVNCSNSNQKKPAINCSQEKESLNKLEGNSFLASLSEHVPVSQCNISARIFRNNYKQHKERLAKKLFHLYNKYVFDNALPDTTVLQWNSRMCSTAGYCCSKKITHRSGDEERVTKIVLSSKVLDRADRLRDTLIHEMCHAATWVINKVSNGHGEYWIEWTNKARKVFPELPPIKRCHNYQINTKYTYKCSGCSYSIGRHRKSLDIERKRCGFCLGKFEVLINKTNKKGEQRTVPITPKREPIGFALFVKENYSDFKEPGVNHAGVMKLLGEKFKEMKV